MAAVAAQDASSSLYSLLIFPSAPPLPPPSFSFLDRGEEAVEETAGEEAVEETAGEEAVEETAGEEAVEETAGEEAVEETAGETVCEQAEPQPKPAGKKKRRNRKKNRMVEVELSGPAYANLQYQARRANCFYPKGSEREGEPDVERFLNEVGQGLHQLDPVPKPSPTFETVWKEVKAELQLPSDCNPTNIEEIEDERAMRLHMKKAQQACMPYLDMIIVSAASFYGKGKRAEEYLGFFEELYSPERIGGYLNKDGGASDDEKVNSQMGMCYLVRSPLFRERVQELCLLGMM
ncbi:hypothetical protein GUITHDRAFT_118696 [Guillardia theta CCMP2712]|uniref:Uncharacterized protein n=2 Tax=Guillardia theta TaxID=55529 RepID=L1IFX6_GUITC|nr:hypothetical protein GUITHDRAFT_118696 [Guillardia theta CCMP2712]EKX35148.1 hypothetical protein GUITHDRAFT_118696 [Guillardia theta CCMP2712]|eukprot:XP_005822128.1 hypothetical protein GUITHDRAFT_118696 [Guillardia theta CCMP2712]